MSSSELPPASPADLSVHFSGDHHAAIQAQLSAEQPGSQASHLEADGSSLTPAFMNGEASPSADAPTTATSQEVTATEPTTVSAEINPVTGRPRRRATRPQGSSNNGESTPPANSPAGTKPSAHKDKDQTPQSPAAPKRRGGNVTHKRDEIADLVHLDANGRAHYTSGVNVKNDANGNNLKDGRSLKGKFMTKHELDVLSSPEVQAQIRDGLADRDEPGQPNTPPPTPNTQPPTTNQLPLIPQLAPQPPQPGVPVNQNNGNWLPYPNWGDRSGSQAPAGPNVMPPLGSTSPRGIRGRIKQAMSNAWDSVQRFAGVEFHPDQSGGVLKSATGALAVSALKADMYLRTKIENWQNLPEQQKSRRKAFGLVAGALALAGAVYLESRGHSVRGHGLGGNQPNYNDTHARDYVPQVAGPRIAHETLASGHTVYGDLEHYANAHGSHPDGAVLMKESGRILQENPKIGGWAGAHHMASGTRYDVAQSILDETVKLGQK